jgi:hypothetical protein
LDKGRLFDFAVAILTSQCGADDDEDGNTIDWQEDSPFHPNGLTRILDQPRPQVEEGNSQSVDGVEQHTEENKNLEKPVLVNVVEEFPNIPAKVRCQNVHCYKDRHPQPADAMQDKRQHGALSLVSQSRDQADIPF